MRGQVLSVNVPETSQLCNSNVSGSKELPPPCLCDPHVCGSVPLIFELPKSRLLIPLVLANIASVIVPDNFDSLASRYTSSEWFAKSGRVPPMLQFGMMMYRRRCDASSSLRSQSSSFGPKEKNSSCGNLKPE
jgi:hypothetical protein